MLSLSFVGLAILFAVWNALMLTRYLRYRQVARGAVLTWERRRPWYFSLCLGIGFFMLALTILSTAMQRPILVIVAEGLMAIFYTVVFPLSFRIRKGFYASGIWTERSWPLCVAKAAVHASVGSRSCDEGGGSPATLCSRRATTSCSLILTTCFVWTRSSGWSGSILERCCWRCSRARTSCAQGGLRVTSCTRSSYLS